MGMTLTLKRWPLWLQLTLALFGTSLLVAVLVGESLRQRETDYLRDLLRRESIRTSQALIGALSRASDNRDQISAIIAGASRQDAAIYSVSFIADRSGHATTLWPDKPPPVSNTVFYYRFPVDLAGRGGGQLVVSWDVAGLLANIKTHVQEIWLEVIAMVGALGVVLVLLINFIVIRPVNRIRTGLDSIARGQTPEPVRFGPVISRELDRLGASVSDLNRYQHELHSTQQSLQVAREEAEHANEAKGRFLAVMSHEIRTPFNGVIGNLELLADAQLGATERTLLKSAQRSADSLLEMINEILDFSRLESGHLTLEDTEFQLEAQINDVVSAMAGIVDHHQVSLVVDFDARLPGRVRGDPLRIRQVLNNLLSNAVKFTRAGHIAVTVRRLDQQRWRVAVKDSGIGIDEQAQSDLFEPFTQADSSTSRHFGGTGLGLSICKQLVEMMGGRIGLISQPGEGSEFWFELPLEALEAPRCFVDAAINGAQAIIFEKDELSARVMGNCLDAFAVKSAIVTSPEELLQRLSDETRSDFILLDAEVLTAAGGNQYLNEIHQHCGKTRPRIIVASSLGTQLLESRLYDAALLKPVRRTDLFNTLSGNTDPTVISGARGRDRNHQVQKIAGRVLLVDDNPMNLQVAKAILERMGITVDAVASGELAFAQMDKIQYRAVLMDEQMPELDGLQTTRVIRARDSADREVPIIALTANADSASEKRCLDAGMNGFMSKPVRRKQLRTVLGQWLPELLDQVGAG